jgi:hypothetical protein
LGLPVLGAVVGASTADCSKGTFLCGVGEAALGYTIGTVAAIAVDAAILARWSTFSQAEPSAPTAAAQRPRRKLTIAPHVTATPSFALVGLGGTFF